MEKQTFEDSLGANVKSFEEFQCDLMMWCRNAGACAALPPYLGVRPRGVFKTQGPV